MYFYYSAYFKFSKSDLIGLFFHAPLQFLRTNVLYMFLCVCRLCSILRYFSMFFYLRLSSMLDMTWKRCEFITCVNLLAHNTLVIWPSNLWHSKLAQWCFNLKKKHLVFICIVYQWTESDVNDVNIFCHGNIMGGQTYPFWWKFFFLMYFCLLDKTNIFTNFKEIMKVPGSEPPKFKVALNPTYIIFFKQI